MTDKDVKVHRINERMEDLLQEKKDAQAAVRRAQEDVDRCNLLLERYTKELKDMGIDYTHPKCGHCDNPATCVSHAFRQKYFCCKDHCSGGTSVCHPI